jgi:hypothetical protein
MPSARSCPGPALALPSCPSCPSCPGRGARSVDVERAHTHTRTHSRDNPHTTAHSQPSTAAQPTTLLSWSPSHLCPPWIMALPLPDPAGHTRLSSLLTPHSSLPPRPPRAHRPSCCPLPSTHPSTHPHHHTSCPSLSACTVHSTLCGLPLVAVQLLAPAPPPPSWCSDRGRPGVL